MVFCLERGADLHTARLMPLPLTVSCFSKIQIGFAFLVPAHLGSPGHRVVKRVRVCVCVVIVLASVNYKTEKRCAYALFSVHVHRQKIAFNKLNYLSAWTQNIIYVNSVLSS